MAEVPRWIVWIVSDPKRKRNFIIAGYLLLLLGIAGMIYGIMR